MDFQLTSLQVDLQEATRAMARGLYPSARLHQMEREGLDRAAWDELAGAGVFSLRVPEADGGVGLGSADAVLVLHELGRALVPGPLVWSHLAAGLDGCDGVVGGLERPGPGATAVVQHLDALDTLVVVDDEGVWRVERPASLEHRRLDPLDPLTPVDAVGSVPRGVQVAGPEVAARWRVEGSALVAALLSGLALGACDLTVAYTKERKQFGRPVGSFQSMKHLLADMLSRAELSRVATLAAGVHLDQPEVGHTERIVAGARVVAGEAAIENGHRAILSHGGMGFTWEVDAHRYLKRAWVLDATFGSVDHHAAALAELL